MSPANPQSDLPPRKPRGKRGKYSSKACNECKRRKSKCNGQRPCERCVHNCLECVFPLKFNNNSSTNPPPSTQVISSLKDQVASLQGELDILRSQPRGHSQEKAPDAFVTSPNVQPGQQRLASSPPSEPILSQCSPGVVTGHGTPVSIGTANPPAGSDNSLTLPSEDRTPSQSSVNYTFNLSLARSYLRQSSVMDDPDSSGATRTADETGPGSPMPDQLYPDFANSTIDPLWLIDKQEALRLCHVYEEEIGISYPFLMLQELVDNVNKLYDAMEAGSRHGFAFSSLPGPVVIDSSDLNILKMALSTALIIESSGSSELGKAVSAKANEAALSKICEPTSVKSIALYTLMAIYAFLSGDDLQAWRLIGIPARWCLELGLHQSATYRSAALLKSAVENKMAIRLFWSVHTLDRRWAFGVGLPFVFQSSDLDSQLPMPDDDVPYLQAMVGYNRIGAAVWSTVYNSSSKTMEPPKDEVDFLHYRIDRWYNELPEVLKLPRDRAAPAPPKSQRGLHRLQLLCFLRLCQMKILLRQPVLQSPARFFANTSQVQMLVDTAKAMIQELDHLNKTTDIYQTQQMCFNHFLVSALGVVFLTVALSPTLYRSVVEKEFHMALDLVRGFSEKSYVSKRLWNMIHGLRQAGFRLGLCHQRQSGDEPQMDALGAGDGNDNNNSANGQNARTSNGASQSVLMRPPFSASSNRLEPLGGSSQPANPTVGQETVGSNDGTLSEFPLIGSQMTLELSGLFNSMDSEDGSWLSGFVSCGSESNGGGRDAERERNHDARSDFTHFSSQIWNSFLQ